MPFAGVGEYSQVELDKGYVSLNASYCLRWSSKVKHYGKTLGSKEVS